MTRTSILFFAIVASAAIVLAQPAPAPAQPPQPQSSDTELPMTFDQQKDLLAIDLKALSRIVALSKQLETSRELMLALIDDDIQRLREPKSDGTYRYAALQRIDAGHVTQQKGIEEVFSSQKLDMISVNGSNVYRLVVSVPEKRNLMSKNSRVYLRNAVIEWTGFDGKTTRTEMAVNQWIDPNDSFGIPIPEIAKNAQATVEVGVESGTKKAVANADLIQAKLVDDPRSPYFNAVQRLQGVRQMVTAKTIARGELQTTIDEGILDIPGEMQKRVAAQAAAEEARKQLMASGQTKGKIEVGDATPDVVQSLGSILTMSRGSLEDQTKAREELETLVKSLKPAEPTAPEPATKP